MLTRDEVEEVMKIEGNVRTATLRTDLAYIKRWEGKEGLNRVEDKLQALGYPIRYEETRALDWCPIGRRVLSLLVIRDVFNWDDENIRAMGFAAPLYSFVARLFMKALASPKQTISRAPDYWASHFNVGKVEVEFHEKEKYICLFVKGFEGHPLLCKHMEGYLERVVQFVLPHQKVSVIETRCVFGGHAHHQYNLLWRA